MKTDVLIMGGGLAGGLIALALARHRPEARVTVVEQGPTFGGNHIWSFFDSDLDDAGREFVDPLVAYRWDGYDVAFPGYRRTLGGGYNSIPSERLDAALRAALPPECLFTGVTVASADAEGVTLADGRPISADAVIDARGFREPDTLRLGWQKFLGQELRLGAPHGLVRPMLMDATVDQSDGYRFVYVLPFAPDRLFVEDTYYTPEPDLDGDMLADRIAAYADAQGWQIETIEREEMAALPIAMGGNPTWSGLPKAGMAAALFHPMTGYSLPDAVRAALLVAGQRDLTTPALAKLLHDHAARAWRGRGFYRMLAAMLFRASPEPAARYRTFQHFYTLGEDLIARFYAARSTPLDKARILIGKPPVPIGRALAVLAGRL